MGMSDSTGIRNLSILLRNSLVALRILAIVSVILVMVAALTSQPLQIVVLLLTAAILTLACALQLSVLWLVTSNLSQNQSVILLRLDLSDVSEN
jgi:hypothetical protein